MSSAQFQVLSVRAAQTGATYLAQVSLTFNVPAGDPVAVTRSAKLKDGWRTFTEAEVTSPAELTVKIETAFLRRSRKGDLFVAANSINIPWEISRAIAEAAFARLNGGQQA